MRARREEHLRTLTGLKTVRYRSYELRDMVCCYAMLCSMGVCGDGCCDEAEGR